MRQSPIVKSFRIASDSLAISGNVLFYDEEIKFQVLDRTVFVDDDGDSVLYAGQWDISIEDEDVGFAYLKTEDEFASEAFCELDEGYEELLEAPFFGLKDVASQYVLVTPRQFRSGYCNTNPVFIHLFHGKNAAADPDAHFRRSGFQAADLFFALHRSGIFELYGFPCAGKADATVYACVYPD